jgi:hypothetical protein
MAACIFTDLYQNFKKIMAVTCIYRLPLVKIDAIRYISGTYISVAYQIYIGHYYTSGTQFVTYQNMPKNYKLLGPPISKLFVTDLSSKLYRSPICVRFKFIYEKKKILCRNTKPKCNTYKYLY